MISRTGYQELLLWGCTTVLWDHTSGKVQIDCMVTFIGFILSIYLKLFYDNYTVDDDNIINDSQKDHINRSRTKILDSLLADDVLIAHMQTENILPNSEAG